jgi:hypothetical protein
MNRSKLFTGLLLVIIGLLAACEQRSGYEKLLEKELASGERYDSLFLGLHFGMSSKDFYATCWELNQQGLVRQGGQNATIVYHLKEQLPHSATMDFYPSFYEDKIVEMPVVFHYDAWSPWNRNQWSDSLQVDVLHLMEKWHGKGFIRTDHPELGTAYVKIDGNRRITVTTLNDQLVKVLYTDMSVHRPKPAAPESVNEEAAE